MSAQWWQPLKKIIANEIKIAVSRQLSSQRRDGEHGDWRWSCDVLQFWSYIWVCLCVLLYTFIYNLFLFYEMVS